MSHAKQIILYYPLQAIDAQLGTLLCHVVFYEQCTIFISDAHIKADAKVHQPYTFALPK